MQPSLIYALPLAAFFVGLACGAIIKVLIERKRISAARKTAAAIIEDAEKEAKTIKKEAELEGKDIVLKLRAEFEKEVQERQKEIQLIEKRLISREENIEKELALVDAKEKELKKQEQSLQDRRKHVEALEKKYLQLVDEAKRSLEKIAGISAADAKEMLKERLLEDAKIEAAKKIKEIEDAAREEGEQKARYIIASCIERLSSEVSSEFAVSTVHLPNDEMKGRIIGREGRNIRALEAATGVDILIDDTPEAVVVSSFNPVRREIAKRALESLIQDGRIHPARIEEMVAKAEKEVNVEIKKAGESAAYELGIHNLHPELIKLLGSLKFRYSYGQNVLDHSKEVAYIAGMMAAELGLDVKKARRAGLLHDIGKAASHEIEGSHAVIGMEYAKKYGEADDIVHAIGAHHEDIRQEFVLDCIIDAADALSGARPGARREVLETYIKRIEDLERISASFAGVEKAYAIQAGREIRVIVDSAKVDDAYEVVLARDIAKKIESEMSYPGQIKVTVIRETRAVDYAK